MTYNIAYLTTTEVHKLFQQTAIALVPLGSLEQHGPHAMMGDYLVVERLTNEIANSIKIPALPTLPFSYSPYFKNYSGTITLQRNTLTAVLADCCLSLKEHGVKTIIFINGHSGNDPIIEEVARNLTDTDFHVYSISLWNTLTHKDKEEIYQEDDPSGHGGEPLTSLYMHYFPDHAPITDTQLKVRAGTWQGKHVKGVSTINMDGIPVNRYFNLDEISFDGVLGNPTNASANRGKKITERIVSNTSRVITEILKLDEQERKCE